MAGGIDIHSHIAGGNVNNARLLSPEIHSNFLENNLKRKSFLPGFNSRWTSEGTGYRYTITKSKRLHPDRVEYRKYDPIVRKHVIFKETK